MSGLKRLRENANLMRSATPATRAELAAMQERKALPDDTAEGGDS